MKTTFFLLLCILSFFKSFSQNIDTIEVKKVKGSYLFLMNGQHIEPLSDYSVLKNFPESNTEYLLARKHVKRGTNYFLLGAAVVIVGLTLHKNTALHSAYGPRLWVSLRSVYSISENKTSSF